MERKTPFQRVREVERQLQSVLAQLDIDALPVRQRELAASIKREATDARLDIRDYGMADALQAQQRLAHEANKRLEQLQKHIVLASEYNIFSAIDVAQLSANIQQIIAEL